MEDAIQDQVILNIGDQIIGAIQHSLNGLMAKLRIGPEDIAIYMPEYVLQGMFAKNDFSSAFICGVKVYPNYMNNITICPKGIRFNSKPMVIDLP